MDWPSKSSGPVRIANLQFSCECIKHKLYDTKIKKIKHSFSNSYPRKTLRMKSLRITLKNYKKVLTRDVGL